LSRRENEIYRLNSVRVLAVLWPTHQGLRDGRAQSEISPLMHIWRAEAATDPEGRLDGGAFRSTSFGQVGAHGPGFYADKRLNDSFERYTHGFLERFCLDYLSDFDVLLIIEEKTAVNVHSYPPLGGNAQSYPALLGSLPGCRPTLARVLTLPLVWLNV
jgi:hypothetical protein